jgi:hypothetical protein
VGELARDSETRVPQDRLAVNPAGAGRKNERLSREICLPASGLATVPVTGREGATEVSSGPSTGPRFGKGQTHRHKAPRPGSEAQ